MSYKTEVIYALCEVDGDPFYVGRSVDWHKRYKEHRYAAKTGGTEVKYQHIRNLWAAGKDFEIVVLEENPGERYEKYWHWLLGCEYNLDNQKMGDAYAVEQTVGKKLKADGQTFATAEEFLTVLDAETAKERIRQAEAAARAMAARTQAKLRNDVPQGTARFVDDVGKEKISEGLQALLNRRKK